MQTLKHHLKLICKNLLPLSKSDPMLTESLKNISSQLDTVQVYDPYEFLSIHLIPFEFITQKLANLYAQVPSVYELNERAKQVEAQDAKLKERMGEFEKVTK